MVPTEGDVLRTLAKLLLTLKGLLGRREPMAQVAWKAAVFHVLVSSLYFFASVHIRFDDGK